MALFPDKLRMASILVRGNVPRSEAEEFAEAIAEAVKPAATDSEVEAQLETRLTAELEPIRRQLEFAEVSTDQKFQAMLARSDARFAEMQAQMQIMQSEFNERMAKMEGRIYRAIGFATALIIGAMSAWPP